MADLILVAGGTGGVGRLIVQKLIERGASVRVLSRDVDKAHRLLGDAIDVAQGDVRKPESLTRAMSGVSAVICAIGSRNPLGSNTPHNVDYEGVQNIVTAAAKANSVHRFVLVSSLSVTKTNHPLNAFGKILTWKAAGEQALRSSGLVYTIVRPGGLTDASGAQSALLFGQGDRIMGTVSRSNVAEVCITALAEPRAENVTFEVIEQKATPPPDWNSLFAGLKPDTPGQTGS
jgi:uncharacterized protein YbjT (DUF2867 family)